MEKPAFVIFQVIWLVVVLVSAFLVRNCENSYAADCGAVGYKALKAYPPNRLLRAGDLAMVGNHPGCANIFIGRYLAAAVNEGQEVNLRSLLSAPVISKPTYRRLPIDSGLGAVLGSRPAARRRRARHGDDTAWA